MSVFNEILSKINEISKKYVKAFNDDLEEALARIDKFEEDYFNERSHSREKPVKGKNPLTILQSINEDEVESKNHKKETEAIENGARDSSSSSKSDGSQRGPKKRGKNEMDDTESPKQDKRQKRNASAKALASISKQVNLNLNHKLRREVEPEKSQPTQKQNEDDKENQIPILVTQIKQEKISIPPEPIEMEPLPVYIELKKEVLNDDIAMPPPVAPIPKPRKLAKEKIQDDNTDETTKRKSNRTKKQTVDVPPARESRTLRSSNRSARQSQENQEEQFETRPKRTRAKKKEAEVKSVASEEAAADVLLSPAEKPRPKRTRKALKAAQKEEPKPVEEISPKEDRISEPRVTSPILEIKQKEKRTNKKADKPVDVKVDEVDLLSPTSEREATPQNSDLDATRVISNPWNSTVTISASNDIDKTLLLTSETYNNGPDITADNSDNVRNMNETVVLEKCSEMSGAVKTQAIMDATVVIEKNPDANTPEITGDNSLLTNDSDVEASPTSYTPHTPPPTNNGKLPNQPMSAVKEKVQQFEELASRVTRTKTRAMAKKEDEPDNQTPPDKIINTVLSTETLSKMNSMIFNGKPPQISSSASKPRPVVPPTKTVSSASKLSAIRAKEAEEGAKREKEDARRKKEAMLEAKREMHRKKREEKMAAAAAARIAAERERKLAVEAMERERREKQAQADQGRVDRLKEAEKKKLELARKVAETEERRRAEEAARQARLAEEQRRADAQRRKQLEDAEAVKKEAAIMAREIEKRKKEYLEKQKMKLNRHDDRMHTPLKANGSPGPSAHVLEPVYMQDGFENLNSDEDDEPVDGPVPDWCTPKARHAQMALQAMLRPSLVDRLFSVRVHNPDLRELFPNIDRARLKRTSSAVWRTPPNRLAPLQE